LTVSVTKGYTVSVEQYNTYAFSVTAEAETFEEANYAVDEQVQLNLEYAQSISKQANVATRIVNPQTSAPTRRIARHG
jgi:hypothetical protein